MDGLLAVKAFHRGFAFLMLGISPDRDITSSALSRVGSAGSCQPAPWLKPQDSGPTFEPTATTIVFTSHANGVRVELWKFHLTWYVSNGPIGNYSREW